MKKLKPTYLGLLKRYILTLVTFYPFAVSIMFLIVSYVFFEGQRHLSADQFMPMNTFMFWESLKFSALWGAGFNVMLTAPSFLHKHRKEIASGF